MKRWFAFAGLAFLSCAPARAELVFDAKTVSVKAGLLDEKADGVFTFTNTGDYPVTIKRVKASCGCTATSLDKKTYQPGETGSITATLTIGHRVGRQKKSVTVRTDDPKNPNYFLMLEVQIPEVLRLKPTVLYWRKGEKREPKSLIAEVMHDEPVRITEVTCSNPKIKMELKELDKGAKYEITAAPGPDEKTRNNTVIIQTDAPKEKPKQYRAYLRFQ